MHTINSQSYKHFLEKKNFAFQQKLKRVSENFKVNFIVRNKDKKYSGWAEYIIGTSLENWSSSS